MDFYDRILLAADCLQPAVLCSCLLHRETYGRIGWRFALEKVRTCNRFGTGSAGGSVVVHAYLYGSEKSAWNGAAAAGNRIADWTGNGVLQPSNHLPSAAVSAKSSDDCRRGVFAGKSGVSFSQLLHSSGNDRPPIIAGGNQ